jgi:hypothetical protein
LQTVAKLTAVLRGQANADYMSGESIIRAALDTTADEDAQYGGYAGPPELPKETH